MALDEKTPAAAFGRPLGGGVVSAQTTTTTTAAATNAGSGEVAASHTDTGTDTGTDIEACVVDPATTAAITKVRSTVTIDETLVADEGLPASADDSAHAEMMYARYSNRRKECICAILALTGFLAPLATTGSLTALKQMAKTFDTTGSVINISNGLYTAAMGVSAFFWAVTSKLGGRRVVLLTSVFTFFCFSVGSALAPNLAAFFVFRILSGCSGTGLMVGGPVIAGDIYRPTERATAVGWILSGTLIGPALGPLIGGIIVTYSSWRNIFWFQAAISGLTALLAVLFVPETAHARGWDALPRDHRAAAVLASYNPVRLFVLFARADLLLVALASAAMLWNMYSFFAPIVYVINPRMHLTTPLQSGLFYLAPGSGYLIATFVGGHNADRVVKKWIRKRGGRRLPSDRLRAAVPFMGVGTPICMLIYGWCLQYNKGGIALLVIDMFIQGLTQLMVFPALNTYCLDVVPGRSVEVLGGNYLIRYLFAAAGTSVAIPGTDGIGIGWFCTISVAFVLVACTGMLLVIHDKVPHFRKRAPAATTTTQNAAR